jgi:flagellar motor switch protein FliM
MGDIRMAIPYASLERHLDRLSKSRFVTTASHAGEFREALASTVAVVPLELGVQLGRTAIRLGDLLELEVGDIVPLAAKPGDLALVPVQGKVKFLGQLGTRGNRYAVRIRRVASDDRPEGES